MDTYYVRQIGKINFFHWPQQCGVFWEHFEVMFSRFQYTNAHYYHLIGTLYGYYVDFIFKTENNKNIIH